MAKPLSALPEILGGIESMEALHRSERIVLLRYRRRNWSTG